jgi:hypothetical protein
MRARKDERWLFVSGNAGPQTCFKDERKFIMRFLHFTRSWRLFLFVE